MKRKGFGEVYDDFSVLSLSTPATKIRRLDADLPPIMEGQPPIGGSVLEHELLNGDMYDTLPDVASVVKNAVFPPTVNEERALVLYKPVLSHFGSSLKMDPELISGLKNVAFWSGCKNLVEEDFVEEQQSSSSNCLAVIPWVPSQFCAPENRTIAGVMEVGVDGDTMEIDIDGGHEQPVDDAGVGSGSITQWQQHCMIPEHTHLKSTPILGSW